MDDEKTMGPYLKLLLPIALAAAPVVAETHFVVVGGLGGEQDYSERFAQEADDLAATASNTVGEDQVALLKGAGATREALEAALTDLVGEAAEEDAVVVYLIGHGTFDGTDYKFNIAGPDVTATRLGQMLDNLVAKRQLIVNMTSCSGTLFQASFATLSGLILCLPSVFSVGQSTDGNATYANSEQTILSVVSTSKLKSYFLPS